MFSQTITLIGFPALWISTKTTLLKVESTCSEQNVEKVFEELFDSAQQTDVE
jgi:hypothetical protein